MSKKGMTQDELVKVIIALVLLAVLIYFIYQFVFKKGNEAATLGDCESKPPQKCMTETETCTGQKFKFGCVAERPYCCVPS